MIGTVAGVAECAAHAGDLFDGTNSQDRTVTDFTRGLPIGGRDVGAILINEGLRIPMSAVRRAARYGGRGADRRRLPNVRIPAFSYLAKHWRQPDLALLLFDHARRPALPGALHLLFGLFQVSPFGALVL